MFSKYAGLIVRPSAVVRFDTFGLKLPVTLASTAAFDCIKNVLFVILLVSAKLEFALFINVVLELPVTIMPVVVFERIHVLH